MAHSGLLSSSEQSSLVSHSALLFCVSVSVSCPFTRCLSPFNRRLVAYEQEMLIEQQHRQRLSAISAQALYQTAQQPPSPPHSPSPPRSPHSPTHSPPHSPSPSPPHSRPQSPQHSVAPSFSRVIGVFGLPDVPATISTSLATSHALRVPGRPKSPRPSARTLPPMSSVAEKSGESGKASPATEETPSLSARKAGSEEVGTQRAVSAEMNTPAEATAFSSSLSVSSLSSLCRHY